MKKKLMLILTLPLCLTALTFTQSCVYNDQTHTYQASVTPQALPIVVDGFVFPEQQDTILNWLGNYDTTRITEHAWGIWAGLTANSNQIYRGDTLLIYETWLGISDIAAQCANNNPAGGCTAAVKSTREQLHVPHQLSHNIGPVSSAVIDSSFNLLVSVSYDPNAACYATTNLMLNQSTIDKYNKAKRIGTIPAFPNNSITIKPTYFLGKQSDSLIIIPAWQGPPQNSYQSYQFNQWGSYIYIDVNNKQATGKVAVPVPDGEQDPAKIESATVNLSEFIYYPIDSISANYINAQQGANFVSAGDLAVLVCMHVATKEISNWTWQTFFWTCDPKNPSFPSSPWHASLQPTAQLNGAAAHYAMATAYAMVWPNQPVTGGTNTNAKPIIAYNPYLEPGLSEFKFDNKLNSKYQYGMQSNCMSCHALASSNKSNGFLGYTGDQYIDMQDTSIYNNWVQLDFAWSIQGNLNRSK